GVKRAAFLLASTGCYAFVAASTYIGSSPLAVCWLSLLWLAVLAYLTSKPRTTLDPFRVMSIAYLIGFTIAPLFEIEPMPAYFQPVDVLLGQASLYALAGYLALALGFRMSDRVSERAPVRTFSAIPDVALAHLGLWVFGMGLCTYLLLVMAAGGFAAVFEKPRTELYGAVPILGWLTTMLTSGGVLYCASRAHDTRIPAWRVLSLALAASTLLFMFQGRTPAVVGLVACAIILHLRRPTFRWWPTILGGAIVYVIAAFVGFARDPEISPLLLHEPQTVLSIFGEDLWGTLRGFMAGGVARLWMVMVVFDRVPSDIDYKWGTSMFFFLSRVLERLGLGNLGMPLEVELYDSLMTFNPYHLISALNPSLIGEMRANFPWPLALIALVLIGFLLGQLLHRLSLPRGGESASAALYALSTTCLATLVLSSIGNDILRDAIVVGPVWLLTRWSASRAASRFQRAMPLRSPVRQSADERRGVTVSSSRALSGR
ncbi:MAG: hypothetical protein ACREQJ_05445, partial [Candidatus Binatia bacterium]